MNTTLLLNAITESLREIQSNPEDSMQDIFNENFLKWNLDLYMNHSFVIEPVIKAIFKD